MSSRIDLPTGLKKKYRIVYLHNPKHFYLNNISIEDLPNGDKLVTAPPRLSRNNRKNFTRLALLKLKSNEQKDFVKKNTQSVLKNGKPFSGIFQD